MKLLSGKLISQGINVAPLAGAWIETGGGCLQSPMVARRPPRGGVD